MPNKNIIKILRAFRQAFIALIEMADKDTLNLISSEIGQMKRIVAGKLKE